MVTAAGALLAGPAPAGAAHPAAGHWSARFSSLKSTRMTFDVNRSHTVISKIVVRQYLVYCFEIGSSSFDTWTFPHVSVNRYGRFSRTYHRGDAKYVIRGRFTSPTRVSGYALEESAGGTCVGGTNWTGTRLRSG